MGTTLLEIRKKYKVSQAEIANLLGIPVRTYIRYEQNDNYGSSLKRQTMIKLINDEYEITEEKGLLTIDLIKQKLCELFDTQYKDAIKFCYLFGSYAKGYATEQSDIDLCVETSLKGLDFIGLIEDVRNLLRKKIDLIRFDTLEKNFDLVNEIMKDGIKIYG
ncbi:MAG: nucleotidyltransferase domain-containing protein [Bacilli bacterium]|nr:nucleotidyltransferase domain-containing protein [Bacilli bacterium]